MKNFSALESHCSLSFDQSGPYWHIWTPENHPVIFHDASAFKAGMNILAICSRLVPEVHIITFELMSNHIHITADGTENNIKKLFALFRRFLSNYLRSKGFCCDLSSFTPHFRMIGTLQDLRNVISYTNRNGFVISPDDTPFSYRWGANSYFFNYAAKERYYESTSFLSRTKRRELIRSHDSDTIVKIKTVDDYACPMDFCAITFAEKLYRNASHYFRDISRNIEAHKTLALEIGESIYYSDDELFSIISNICKERYGQYKPSLIPANAKRELAIQLHRDYNAGNKQIHRLLKIDLATLAQLFPEQH